MPHACVGDTDVKWEGFTLPKGCTILFNLDSILQDPEIFENPEQFNPERFLDVSGRVVRPKGFVPFGTGRRVCPGEKLSWMEMFLFLTVLMQNFNFVPKEIGELPSLIGAVTLGRFPRPFEIRAIPRHHDHED